MDRTLETYERIADAYERRHGDGDGRSTGDEEIASALERFTDRLPAGGTVLDVGCGPGWETAALDAGGYDVVGLDLTRGFCDQAAERAPGRVLQADMRTLPLADDAVAGIWACASLLHVPREDVRATIEGFGRVLEPRGHCWLTVKEGEGTTTGDGYEDDDRSFTLFRGADLEARFERAGFSVETLRHDDVWLQVLARLEP
jgi:SAM-dependent methyltransferase